LPLTVPAQTSNSYVQTNIISDGAVSAMQTDPTLINPWGVSIGTQFWINAAGSGNSLVENGDGTKSFAVTVPPASSSSPHGLPAGTLYNSDATLFPIPGGPAQFLFSTLDGTISAWNATDGPAVIMINNSAAGAVYTDIAVDKASSGSFLLAANFASGKVEIFSSSFAPTQLTGTFSDPAIPSGYSPFGIHQINGKIFVTYAEVNSQGREAVGAGLGYVDVFNSDGTLVQNAISQGNLNAPWGMALAPSGFGLFAGDLLVGNFGDGIINAYDPTTFAFIGQLQDGSGNPIANPGLWEIIFGTNGVGDSNTLYFAAGINSEKDGLFGSIASSSVTTGGGFTFQSSSDSVNVTTTAPGSLTLNLASQNSFTGSVTFSCSGLPADTNCSFSPSSVNLTSSSTQKVTATISVTSTGPGNPYNTGKFVSGHRGIVLAFVGPVGLLALAGFRRRSLLVRRTFLMAFIGCIALAAGGCGSSSSGSTGGTPTSAQAKITATSGNITHSIPITITVQ
jgi:uncharacterized protein (TIGR03118 family)